MSYNVFVLYKRGEPIAQGSMEHCLDVYYWESVLHKVLEEWVSQVQNDGIFGFVWEEL